MAPNVPPISPTARASRSAPALIGYGEAAGAFDLEGDWPAFDLIAARSKAPSLQAAIGEAGLILSLVTADQAVNAAREAAYCIRPHAIYADCNSVAPQTKQEAAALIEAAGGRYVDVAVMSPVHPARRAVPLLLSGTAADEGAAALTAAGFTDVKITGERVGQASAIKLCRSVMVKGMEALTAEMAIAANSAGVLAEVLASLDASERPKPWAERTDYNLDRMLLHGRRRAAEMDEACVMLRGLGIAPLMSERTVTLQSSLGSMGLAPPPESLSDKLAAIQYAMPNSPLAASSAPAAPSPSAEPSPSQTPTNPSREP